MRRPGFAVLRYDEVAKTVIIEKLSNVDNKKSRKSHGEMLSEVFDELFCTVTYASELSKRFKCDLVLVRERGFSRFAAETQALYKTIGIADYIAWKSGLPFSELSPMTIKKLVTGNAKAKKDEVASALDHYVGKRLYDCDDESDAVAVGIAWLIEHK